MKLYDFGLGVLVILLIAYIAVQGHQADKGDAINCKLNPAHAKCEYNLNR